LITLESVRPLTPSGPLQHYEVVLGSPARRRRFVGDVPSFQGGRSW
jgi:hypothetical protein